MVSDIRDFYKQKRTCCMTVPLFQGGLLAILYINGIFAMFCSAMAFFGPKILGLVQPKIMSYAFGGLYASIALIQVYGIICADRNMMDQFRIFKNISMFLIGGTAILAFIFILASSAQHTSAIGECMNAYRLPISASFKKKIEESKVTSNDAAVNSAMTVCDIFTWFQLGVMILCWIIVVVVQVYFELKKKVFYELKYEDYLEDNS